jgi:hypothetical protein
VSRPIRLILDTSAVRAYPTVDVGEPISEINDEGAGFGVPVTVLAAATAVGNVDSIDLLTKHEAFVPVDLPLVGVRGEALRPDDLQLQDLKM